MCTAIRFTDRKGNLYFGRNLDWCCSYGERVVVTPRGYVPSTSPFGAVGSIRHAVIGMGVVARDTPLYFDCANDAGLAVAGLNFPGYARYETKPVDGLVNVASWELPLWVAASFSSVDEAESALANAAVVDAPIDDDLPTSYLHWIVADARRSIAVEYTDAGMQVFDDDADVLANQPGFSYHAENLRSYLNLTSDVPATVRWRRAELSPYGTGAGMRGLPGDYYSPSRFVRAAYLNAHYPDQEGEAANVTRLFQTLGGVSMVEGAARMANGQFERTVYAGGFSSATGTYYWHTYENPTTHSVSLADCDTEGTDLVEAG